LSKRISKTQQLKRAKKYLIFKFVPPSITPFIPQQRNSDALFIE
jgi:hypothetical protein